MSGTGPLATSADEWSTRFLRTFGWPATRPLGWSRLHPSSSERPWWRMGPFAGHMSPLCPMAGSSGGGGATAARLIFLARSLGLHRESQSRLLQERGIPRAFLQGLRITTCEVIQHSIPNQHEQHASILVRLRRERSLRRVHGADHAGWKPHLQPSPPGSPRHGRPRDGRHHLTEGIAASLCLGGRSKRRARSSPQHMLRRRRLRRCVPPIYPLLHASWRSNSDLRPGGPTAAVIALHNPGIRVTVADRDEAKIRRWNSRHAPIYEPQLREVLRVARDGARKTSLSNVPVASDSSSASDTSECGSQCGSPADRMTLPAREPNLFFSTEVGRCISEADLVLVAVNTPTKGRGIGAGSATDMASFEAVIAEVAKHTKPGAIIVEKSTVPCRTAELVKQTVCPRLRD